MMFLSKKYTKLIIFLICVSKSKTTIIMKWNEYYLYIVYHSTSFNSHLVSIIECRNNLRSPGEKDNVFICTLQKLML